MSTQIDIFLCWKTDHADLIISPSTVENIVYKIALAEIECTKNPHMDISIKFQNIRVCSYIVYTVMGNDKSQLHSQFTWFGF